MGSQKEDGRERGSESEREFDHTCLDSCLVKGRRKGEERGMAWCAVAREKEDGRERGRESLTTRV